VAEQTSGYAIKERNLGGGFWPRPQMKGILREKKHDREEKIRSERKEKTKSQLLAWLREDRSREEERVVASSRTL